MALGLVCFPVVFAALLATYRDSATFAGKFLSGVVAVVALDWECERRCLFRLRYFDQYYIFGVLFECFWRMFGGGAAFKLERELFSVGAWRDDDCGFVCGGRDLDRFWAILRSSVGFIGGV